MINVKVHPLALREYRRAVKWYRKRSILAAERFEQYVHRALEQIKAQPRMAIPFRKHYFWVKVKRYPFLIYYEHIDGDNWLVNAISHQHRRPGYWIRRS